MPENLASAEGRRFTYGFIPYISSSVSECVRDVMSNTEKLTGPIITTNYKQFVVITLQTVKRLFTHIFNLKFYA